jgi:hypothetical protein
MRGLHGLQALKRLVQSEPELLALSERLVSGTLASSSGPSAAAISALTRHEAALHRLAPRLFSTLVAGGRSGGGGLRQGGGLAARLLQQQPQAQQVRHCSCVWHAHHRGHRPGCGRCAACLPHPPASQHPG